MIDTFLKLFGALVTAGEAVYRSFRNLKDFFMK